MSKLIISSQKLAILTSVVVFCANCTSSSGEKKHEFLNADDHSQMRKAHQKSTSIISIEALGDDQFKIIGAITAHEDLMDAQTFWKIPDNAELVSGNLSEALNLAAGDSTQISITISGLRDGGKIVLLPHKVIQGEKHGTPTLYVHGQKAEASKSSVQQKGLSSKKKRIFQ